MLPTFLRRCSLSSLGGALVSLPYQVAESVVGTSGSVAGAGSCAALWTPRPRLGPLWGARDASAKANSLRPGMLVEQDGKLLTVSKAVHTPGIARQGGIVQLEFRDVVTGSKVTGKLAPDAMVALADAEKRKLQLLYSEGRDVHLMDPENFEQFVVSKDLFTMSAAAQWMQEGMSLEVLFHEGRPLSVQIPVTVTVQVTETAADRISDGGGAKKAAQCDTGATVMVPAFVQKGEHIVVNTTTGEFVRRSTG